MRIIYSLLASVLCASLQAGPVTALAFSPDGRMLLSNGDGRIEKRSIETGDVIGSWPCSLPRITCLAFDRTGEWLAAGGGVPGEQGRVLLFHHEKPSGEFGSFKDLVSGLSFSHDSELLAVSSADHSSEVWRYGSKPSKVSTLLGHSGPVLTITFHPVDRTVVTGSADGSLKVWNAETGALLRTLNQHTEAVSAVAFAPALPQTAPNTILCASASSDRTVRVWQPGIGRMVRIVREHAAPALALGFSSDGKSIFSAGQEGLLRRIDAGSDQILESWTISKDWIYALVVSPDGTRVATGDWAGKVRLTTLK